MTITLSQLNIYPVKSCGRISVTRWSLESRGLQHDRRWMLVDDEGVFVTQREYPRLALVEVQIKASCLQIGAPGMDQLRVPFEQHSHNYFPVVIWDDGVEALDAGTEPSEWFSEFLGASIRLAVMSDRSVRTVDKKFAVNDDVMSFADAFPLLLISEGSLHDLNSRLTSPITMNRFRPNLVVSGCEPYAEDRWKEIKIGTISLRVVKPCARCAITTVDPETGEKGIEPLRTLATYRALGNKVLFGQNVIHTCQGELRVGDVVNVLSS